MNKLKLIFLSIMISSLISVHAEVNEKPIEMSAETTVANMDTVIKDNFIKAKFASASNRFMQGNVKASYDDFSDLIDKTSHDDYVFLLYGLKMAEYGLFDLSDNLVAKLDNNHFTASYVTDMKNYYYPSALLNQKEILYLSDAYADIIYNNLALETTSELLNTTKAGASDYKNYLISLGYYKSNNLPLALKYINYAIKENSNNVNYLSLKARILADSKKSSQALKILAQIKKIPFKTTEFQQKVKATEEYVLYKTAKNKTLSDYHLAYYYHLQNKCLLATKVLQSAILNSKQYSSQIYSLLGRIYYENDEQSKAEEFALKAYKGDKNNYLAAQTLGDISYNNKQYKNALKYYQRAKKNTKDRTTAEVGIAKSYFALSKTDKAKKMYEKLLKNNKYNEDLLVESLKVIPQRVDYYLPRVASIDLSNNEIWLGLANNSIKDGNYKMATTYLNNSYYIDENNFKYYYYLSLVLRAKGDIELANSSLARCSNINADYAASINSGVYEK